MTATHVSERFRCKTKDCPWPKDEEIHVPWCLHIQGVSHRRDEPWHQHWPKKGMGAGRTEARIVAVLCSYCSDKVDNTPGWDNSVSPGEDGAETYILWDTQVEGGWVHPLIERKLEAGSAAAGAREVFSPPAKRVACKTARSSAAAPSASGESSAAEAVLAARPMPNATAHGGSLAAPFSLDDWQEEGKKLAEMGYALKDATSMWQFTVGDWFVRGEDALGEEVYGHIDWVGFSSVALRQYAWVAAKVAQNTRVSNLPWTYHRAVAALPEPEQKEWLAKAQEEKLSSKDLNRAINPPKPKPECPEVVTLCGSTRFFNAYREANLRLTLEGKIVLSVGCDTKSDHELFTPERLAEIKPMLDELHLRKIDLSDAILVLNVGGYVGESTSREIEYAHEHRKRVDWLEAK